MSECGLFWVGGTLFWVGEGEWGWVGHYFERVGVSGKIFWVGGGQWGSAGVGALFDNALFKLRFSPV